MPPFLGNKSSNPQSPTPLQNSEGNGIQWVSSPVAKRVSETRRSADGENLKSEKVQPPLQFLGKGKKGKGLRVMEKKSDFR